MVSYAIKADKVLAVFGKSVQSILNLPFQTDDTGVVDRNPAGGNKRAIIPFPAKRSVWQFQFLFTGAQEQITVHAALSENLGKGAVVPEAVHVVADSGSDAEAAVKILLSIKPLPDEAFAAGKVAVRLYPPAAADDPAVFLDLLRDPGK